MTLAETQRRMAAVLILLKRVRGEPQSFTARRRRAESHSKCDQVVNQSCSKARPLISGDRIARTTADGAPMAQEAAAFIKANDRLTSLERLEIYSRSYWFRLLDSLRDDFPALAAVLGPPAFERLARAYLADCPSQSFTLRDLGSRMGRPHSVI